VLGAYGVSVLIGERASVLLCYVWWHVSERAQVWDCVY